MPGAVSRDVCPPIQVTLLETPPPAPPKPESVRPPPPPPTAREVAKAAPLPVSPPPPPVAVLPNESPLMLKAPIIACSNPDPVRAEAFREAAPVAERPVLSPYWLSVRAALAGALRYPPGRSVETNILVRVERSDRGFVVAAPAARGDVFARSVRAAADRVAAGYPPPPVEDPPSAEWMVRFVK